MTQQISLLLLMKYQNFHLMTGFMLFALFKCYLTKHQKQLVPFNDYLFETRAAMLLILYSSITGKFNYNWIIIIMIIVIVEECDQSNVLMLNYRFWLWVCMSKHLFRSNIMYNLCEYLKSGWNSSTRNKNEHY